MQAQEALPPADIPTTSSPGVPYIPDHTYCTNDDTVSLKQKYDDLAHQSETNRKELQNTKHREKRAKQSLEALLNKMKEIRSLSDEAHSMLESYKGNLYECFVFYF